MSTAPAPAAISISRSATRAGWLKLLHQWHWVSAALSLLGLIAFAVTGITLNHASQIKTTPQVQTRSATVPADVMAALREAAPSGDAAVPAPLARWLQATWQLAPGARLAEWRDDEMLLSLQRPGGDGWISLDLATGQAEYETTDRGWISYFNDLHKGRHTGPMWGWFIDLFALACLVFAVTGLLLMQLHAARRPATWPLTALGLLLPLILILLFVH